MTAASGIFLTLFFSGFIIAVVIIYNNRKKIWAKNDDVYRLNNDVYYPGDISIDHSNSDAGHHGSDSVDTGH